MRFSQVSFLTQKQASIAQEYHNLIYTFLRRKNLPISDYYDIAAMGFLRGIVKHDTSEYLHKYSLTTIVWNCMRTDIGNYFKSEERRKDILGALSLDYENDGISLGEAIPSTCNIELDYEDYEFVEGLKDKLNSQELLVVNMLFSGYGIGEISENMELSQADIQASLMGIGEKLGFLSNSKNKSAMIS